MANNLSSHTETPTKVDGFPPFQKETFASQLIWFMISFVLLYVLVARWGLPRVRAILEERREHIGHDVAEARRQRAETHSLINAYEGALEGARNRAGILISETQNKVDAEAKRNRKTWEMELKARILQADKTIAAAKAASVGDVRGIAIESARVIVARLIGGVPSEEMVEKTVDHVLKR